LNPDAIPRQVVVTALRLQLPYFAAACIIAVGAVCSLVLARLKSRDRLLLWVGIFSMLYAARLFVQNELVRAAFNSPGTDYLPFALAMTYAINVPFAFFGLELLGRGWKDSLAIWSWLCIGFAIVAVPLSLIVRHELHWVNLVNGVLVMGGTLLVLLHVVIARRRGNQLAASLLWPLLFCGACVLLENEGFQIGGQTIEPIGFLVLMIGLGSIALRRALTTERKLVDVEQELATARRIQFSILPERVPKVEGLRLASRYVPMTSVAGDFYDFLTPSEDLLTILVADVSGHGVPAALVSSMLKVCFAAQENKALSPAAILSGLATMLRGNLGGQYVTAACATINRKARTITYAGAGHPPSVLVRSEQRDSLLLDQNGLFLGPFPHATYDDMSVPFRKGDRLLLYTDGITEARDFSGEEFGRERLQKFLIDSNGTEPNSALEQLFTQIATGNPQDDLTAVLIHFE
jgi:sigma-B regulation protein RsbU (phosphoserine phosphatase)